MFLIMKFTLGERVSVNSAEFRVIYKKTWIENLAIFLVKKKQ